MQTLEDIHVHTQIPTFTHTHNPPTSWQNKWSLSWIHSPILIIMQDYTCIDILTKTNNNRNGPSIYTSITWHISWQCTQTYYTAITMACAYIQYCRSRVLFTMSWRRQTTKKKNPTILDFCRAHPLYDRGADHTHTMPRRIFKQHTHITAPIMMPIVWLAFPHFLRCTPPPPPIMAEKQNLITTRHDYHESKELLSCINHHKLKMLGKSLWEVQKYLSENS